MAWKEDAHINKARLEKIYGRHKVGGAWTRMDKKLLSWASRNYFFEDFIGQPVAALTTGAAAGGTTGNENYMWFGPNVFQYHILGTQTRIIPEVASTGLDISLDQTENDGVEVTNGITAADAKRVFTVGTDPAFFFRVKFSIADVSGTDDCAMGFRKAEAFQANIDDYDEMAALNVISGDIYIETILNDAATSSTDTTDNWADAATHTLEVRVNAAGVVTFLIDGAAPSTTATFTFDDTEVVVPFFYFLHDANLCDTLILQEWEWGYL